MRPDEDFAAKTLADFLGGPAVASVMEGDNPPDFYLDFGDRQVGVEASQLFQFTFKQDGTFGNRTTEDFYALGLVGNLDTQMGELVPDGMMLMMIIETPIATPRRFERQLRSWTRDVLRNCKTGHRETRQIEGAKVRIHVTSARPAGKKIVGFIANRNVSADISLNASLLLVDRIRAKSVTCSALKKPVWLVLINDYWLADTHTYTKAAQELHFDHCFEKIFLISDDAVTELKLKNENLLA